MSEISDLIQNIDLKYRSGSSHTFLLHLNINDGFLDEDGGSAVVSLAEYIARNSFVSEAKFVMFFNISDGIRFATPEMQREFFEMFGKENGCCADNLEKSFQNQGADIEQKINFAIFLLSNILKKAKEDASDRNRSPLFVVFFEYLETIASPQSACSSEDKDRVAHVALLSLAKDLAIRRSGNAIFLLAESLSSVSEALKSETNLVTPLKVQFPDRESRRKLFQLATDNEFSEEIAEDFARNSAGLSSNIVVSFVRENVFSSESISLDDLFQKKKQFLEDQSGNLLEIHKPFCGIDVIGGLEEHKSFIKDVVVNMKAGRLLAIPSGILLLGVQGTGKTVFVEAIAHEAGMPFVSLKNVRTMWVGQSERNLEFAIELILAQAPVIVFIDEVDQELQLRSSVGDNTGVNQRLQGRLFRVMSDTNLRGQVLWVAATNRPDLLDPALLREGRFDEKIPFFPPNAQERTAIVKALIRKNEILAQRHKINLEVDLSEDDIVMFARRAHCHLGEDREIIQCDWERNHQLGDKEMNDEVYFTGGKIESLITKAIAQATKGQLPLKVEHLFWALNDSLPSLEMASHQSMTELAMRYANSLRFIPKDGRWSKIARRLKIADSAHDESRTQPRFKKSN